MGVEWRNGYLRVVGSRHPLAKGDRGRVDLPRMLAGDDCAGADGPCHHCGWPVAWSASSGDGKLVVDHLDGEKRNLAPGNLVRSCWWCNRVRHLADAAGFDLGAVRGVAPSRRPRLWERAAHEAPAAAEPMSFAERAALLRR